MNLSLELDFNIQIELQSQAQLLALALTAALLLSAHGLSSGVTDLIDGITSCILNRIGSTVYEFAAWKPFGNTIERATALLLLLLPGALAIATSTSCVGNF